MTKAINRKLNTQLFLLKWFRFKVKLGKKEVKADTMYTLNSQENIYIYIYIYIYQGLKLSGDWLMSLLIYERYKKRQLRYKTEIIWISTV